MNTGIYKKSIILKIIAYGPLIFIPLVIIIIFSQTIQMYNEVFKNNIKEIEKNLHDSQKESMRTKVKNISQVISYRKSLVEQNLELTVKDRVDRAYNTAKNIYEKYKTTKSHKEIKEIIKTSLESSTWNDGESYIWILDYEGFFVLAPKYLKHLQDKSIIDFKDATGSEVIKDEINICKTKGYGFLHNSFTKPNGIVNKLYDQVAYVKSFGHYDWYFGSSEFLETATKKSEKILLNTIRNIDTASNHYIILIDTKANVLISKSQPSIVGKNLYNVPTLKDITSQLQNLLKKQNNAYITYDIVNPKTNNIEKKHTYFTKVPNSNWVVGSGFYESDIEDKLSQKKISVYSLFLQKSQSILYIALVVIVLALIISYFISKKLRKYFCNYEKSIRAQKNKLKKLNETLEFKVNQRTAELEKVKNDFKILATTDSLTKIHNRYSLMKILALEIDRSNRYKTPLCLIMFDVDNFKNVNDSYGHDVGDKILFSIASLMKKSLRSIDIAGRYGGEEFIAILPNTTLKEAKTYAHRLRRTIDEHTFDLVGNITVSIGLVEKNEDENINKLFKRLDELVYISKENGKNIVSF